MKRKPSAWESFAEFISGKGFYLVVLLCVVVIGVSGWFLVRSLTGGDDEPSTAAAATAQMPVVSAAPSAPAGAAPSVSPSQPPAVSPKPVSTPAPVPSAQPAPAPTPPSASKPAEEPAPSRKPAALVFTKPVNGPVIASFSVEALLYDETMLDWRVHEGMDLAAGANTRVLAAAAGVVSAVYEDEFMGTTVVIDHDNGLTSVYANLDPEVLVSVGDEVYTGDIIGAVGLTAIAESGRGYHLHFAMYQDGKPVDPEEYLPK